MFLHVDCIFYRLIQTCKPGRPVTCFKSTHHVICPSVLDLRYVNFLTLERRPCHNENCAICCHCVFHFNLNVHNSENNIFFSIHDDCEIYLQCYLNHIYRTFYQCRCLSMLLFTNVVVYQCCCLTMLLSFNVVVYQCCCLSMLLSTNVVVYQCCCLPMLLSINVVVYQCCCLSMSLYINVVVYQCCRLPMVLSINVVVYQCCCLSMLLSINVVVYQCCCLPICCLSMSLSINVVVYQCCCLSMLLSIHVVVYQCCCLSMLLSINVVVYQCCCLPISLLNLWEERLNLAKMCPYLTLYNRCRYADLSKTGLNSIHKYNCEQRPIPVLHCVMYLSLNLVIKRGITNLDFT